MNSLNTPGLRPFARKSQYCARKNVRGSQNNQRGLDLCAQRAILSKVPSRPGQNTGYIIVSGHCRTQDAKVPSKVKPVAIAAERAVISPRRGGEDLPHGTRRDSWPCQQGAPLRSLRLKARKLLSDCRAVVRHPPVATPLEGPCEAVVTGQGVQSCPAIGTLVGREIAGC